MTLATRAPRGDAAGVWHHVMNRAIARRTVFEDEQDVRVFLCLLAQRVRAGEIEVHAYSILTTHFHLLVRSPVGKLSYAMMQLESNFVRWFNAKRERDGPLFRSRFRSRIVDDRLYWWTLVRYIDHNAVDAGMVARPADYAYGSARAYVDGVHPPWLTTSEVQQRATAIAARPRFDAETYDRAFGREPNPAMRWMIDRNNSKGPTFARRRLNRGPAPLSAAPPHVVEALRENAEVADGSGESNRRVTRLLDPRIVRSVVEAIRDERGPWILPSSRGPSTNVWATLEIGLLSRASELTTREIAAATATVQSEVVGRIGRHQRLFANSPEYVERFEELRRRCEQVIFEHPTH